MTKALMTPGQRDQLKRLFEDGGKWATEIIAGELSQDEAQRVLGMGDELRKDFPELIRTLAKGRYADEEVECKYCYLSGYDKPSTIEAQIDIIRKHWPKLNPDAALKYYREVYATLRFPEWVEGPFATIRPGFFSDVYGEEVEEVLKAIAKDRDGAFYNCRENQLSARFIRPNERVLAKLRALIERQQGSDILITASQFGIRWGGRSVRRAREMFAPVEYGEGAKNVSTMILTNPIRLQNVDDLWLDCPGDDFSDDGDEQFERAPYFFFRDGKAKFGTRVVSSAYDYFGSVSSALPQ